MGNKRPEGVVLCGLVLVNLSRVAGETSACLSLPAPAKPAVSRMPGYREGWLAEL